MIGYFHRRRILEPDFGLTIIGDVDGNITTAQDLADLISEEPGVGVYDVTDIKNFAIDGIKVSANLITDYAFKTSAMDKTAFVGNISYYFDVGGRCLKTTSQTFYQQGQLKNIFFPNLNEIQGIRNFRQLTLSKLVRFESVLSIPNTGDPQTFQSLSATILP